ERQVDFVKSIATGGILGAWNWIVTKLDDIKTSVMEQIKTWVTESILIAGVEWIIGLLNPAGAFIKACKVIYEVAMSFVGNGSQLKDFVDSVLDSISEVASGNLGRVAQMIEDSLARVLPLAIGFLASLLGIGGLGEKIKHILSTVQKPVTKVIDWLVNK